MGREIDTYSVAITIGILILIALIFYLGFAIGGDATCNRPGISCLLIGVGL